MTACSETDTAPTAPVDAVITWVNGNDPVHVQKRAKALAQEAETIPSTILAGVDATRFEDNNEIQYCLRSLRKFAPWLRNIFLVTDQQRPAFLTADLQQSLGVKIVDHAQLFVGHENVLPTFNSLSIETTLHRIPELAERYIYLNDDFILMAPSNETDFFIEDGVVLYGKWQPLREYGKTRLWLSKRLNSALKSLFGINRAMSVLQQMRGANLAGASKRFYKVGHTPYPMRKSTLEAFFAQNHDQFTRNIAYRFRNLDQYAVTSVANQLEICSGHASLRDENNSLMICFNRDSKAKIRSKLMQIQRDKNLRFLCVQSLEQASETERETLFKHMQERILTNESSPR